MDVFPLSWFIFSRDEFCNPLPGEINVCWCSGSPSSFTSVLHQVCFLSLQPFSHSLWHKPACLEQEVRNTKWSGLIKSQECCFLHLPDAHLSWTFCLQGLSCWSCQAGWLWSQQTLHIFFWACILCSVTDSADTFDLLMSPFCCLYPCGLQFS